VLLNNTFARDKNNKIIFPLNNKGKPIYKQDIHGNESYEIDSNNVIIFAKDQIGNECYAKTANGEEIYPGGGVYALDKDGVKLYALDANGEVVFDKNSQTNDEMYLSTDGFPANSIITINGSTLKKYAKNVSKDEFYPTKTVKTFTNVMSSKQIVLNKSYARLHTNIEIYPLDEYGNEYVIIRQNDWMLSIPNGYPITNDNWTIVPKVNGQPHFLANATPVVTAANLTRILYRKMNKFSDYVSNVKSVRNARSNAKLKYRTRSIGYGSLLYYVIGALFGCFLLGVAIYFKFFHV
jgi:hypothetical protein